MSVEPIVHRAGPDAPLLCGPVLRSVPEWFGIESATLAHIAETAKYVS